MKHVFIICLFCLCLCGCGDTSVSSESSAVANPDIVSGSEASIPPVECGGCDTDAMEVADYMWRVVNLVMDGTYESYGTPQETVPDIDIVTEVYVDGVSSLESGDDPVSVEADFDDAIDDLLDNEEVNEMDGDESDGNDGSDGTGV